METDGKCVNHHYLTQDLSTFLPSNINHLAEIEKNEHFSTKQMKLLNRYKNLIGSIFHFLNCVLSVVF